jgi:hypothetical protein
MRRPVLGWQERADEAEWRAREALDLVRISAALARLTTWYPRSGSAERDRLISDQRPWDADVPAAPGLTRERFLRYILANKQLPDGYAREVALETLGIPEERFRKMVVSRDGQLAQGAEARITEEARRTKFTELLEHS